MGNQSATSNLTHLKTKAVIKEASQRVGQRTIDQLSTDWQRVAKDKSKSIDYEQFKQLMDNMQEDALKALFALYDLNNDNKITWKEYVCVVALIMKGTLEEKVLLLFNAFDENKDGKISRREFTDAVKKFSNSQNIEGLTPEWIDGVFQKCDKDGNGEISLVEFYQFLEEDGPLFNQVCGILAVGVGT